MSRAGRKIGVGIVTLGLALTAAGVFVAGGASAHAFSCVDASHPDFGMIDGPAQYWDVTDRIDAADINPAAVNAGGQTFDRSPLQVTLTNATSSDGQPVTNSNLGSVDFAVNVPVDAAFVMSPLAQFTWSNGIVVFPSEVTSGTLSTTQGSIEFIEFCYDLEPGNVPTTSPSGSVAPTSVVAPTSQVAPTTVAVSPTSVANAPTTVAAQGVLPQTEVAGITEVLPQQVATQPQLAFTGSDSTTPLVLAGAALMLVGLTMVGLDHFGGVRRSRHSR